MGFEGLHHRISDLNQFIKELRDQNGELQYQAEKQQNDQKDAIYKKELEIKEFLEQIKDE